MQIVISLDYFFVVKPWLFSNIFLPITFWLRFLKKVVKITNVNEKQ